ncbi:hypothetical protein MMC30_007970 [Trapelia coarctata]|nr:hypothetical protein [Trapelia coarctata]
MRQLPNQRTASQPHGLCRGSSQGSAWLLSQPPFPTPLYYDYSEAFEEQHHPNSPNISVLSLTEHVESENRPPGDGTEIKVPEIQLNNAQLEDPSGSASKSPNRSQLVLESPSPVSAPNKFLKQMSEWQREQNSTHDSPNEFAERHEPRNAINSPDQWMKVLQKQGAQGPAYHDKIGHHILSSSRPQTRDRFVKGSSRTICEMSTSCMSYLQDGVSDARVPPDAVTGDSHSLHPPTPHKESHSHISDWEIPSLSFGPLELAAGERGIEKCQPKQNVVFAPSLNVDHPAIQAPVPKRSSSSRSEGDRFSRILSIDEGFAELARAVLDSGLQSDAPPNTPVDAKSRSKSLLYQDSTKFQNTKLSSGLSVSACNSTDVRNRPSSIQEHQEESQTECMQNAISSSCNLALTRTVKGLSQAHIALPELQRSGSPLAQPKEAPTPKQSIDFNSGLPELTGYVGSSDIHLESGAMPEESKKSSAPPVHHPAIGHSRPPHSAPALARSKDETATMALLEAASILPWEYDELKNDDAFPITKNKLRTQSEGASRGPSLRPQPSDVNANHQWTGLFEKRGPSPPNPLNKPQSSKAEAPKFKLKVTRASSSTNGTVRVTLSPTSSPRHSFGTSFNLFQGQSSRHRSKTESTTDGNLPLALAAELRPETGITTVTPQISIRPSSPTLHFADVRSFFSDDSSNVEQKSSLRQRLSQLKVIAHRGNSTDDLRNSDRKQTGSAGGQAHGSRAESARHNRRSSVQSCGTTGGFSYAKHTRWKFGGRLKSWWQRGGDKLKGLGKKMKKGRKKRLVSSDLYVGV